MIEWILILTISTSRGSAIEAIPMHSQASCEKAGKEWGSRFINKDYRFWLCVPTHIVTKE